MISIPLVIALVVYGLLAGSFMNVCILRIPQEKSVVFPRSACMHCGKVLSPLELVPLFSYVFLGGKCSGCKEKISPRYFFVELLSGILFFAVPAVFQFRFFESAIFLYFACVLVVVFFIDLDHQIIPDVITYPSVALGALASFKNSFSGGFIPSISGAVLGFGVFYLIAVLAFAVFKKEALGFGDVKFAAVMGVFLGWKALIFAMYCSFLAGGIIGGALMLMKFKSRRDYIPFGPFLVAGSFITLFFKDKLFYLYEAYTRFYY